MRTRNKAQNIINDGLSLTIVYFLVTVTFGSIQPVLFKSDSSNRIALL